MCEESCASVSALLQPCIINLYVTLVSLQLLFHYNIQSSVPQTPSVMAYEDDQNQS